MGGRARLRGGKTLRTRKKNNACQTADMAETSVKQRAAGMEGGSDGDGDGSVTVARERKGVH